MDVAAFLGAIRAHPSYSNQIVHTERLAPRDAVYGTLQPALPGPLRTLLAAREIKALYSHQTEAIQAAREENHWVVVTGTASGKTLCYNVPILEACLQDPEARALYLFPTKALAQDQFKGLLELVGDDAEVAPLIKPGVYDGDTPTAQRRRIKAEANLVLSNPDMLHASILPYHPKWARFFANLKYVVLDEVHTYRGILGANVACVIRRLQRVCQHYGASPTFLCASATIANPGELSSRLIGEEVVVIDNDGSPRGPKFFVLWNPESASADTLARRSAADDAVWLMVEAVQRGGQCLTFTRTRQAAELVNRYAQDELRGRHSPLADAVRAYRGGYLPEERRQIEQDLFGGKLRGVAATNALELGIDVGSLDVALLVNYPGTIASTWQQAGRSGRRQDESLAVLLAGNDPIDQYLLRNPQYFFEQTPEHAVVDPENPYVLARHLQAATFELPMDPPSLTRFGEIAPSIAEVLTEAEKLTLLDHQFYYAGDPNPAHKISLRHMSEDTFSIILVNQRDPTQLPARMPHRTFQRRVDAPHPPASGELPRHRMSHEHEIIANVDAISAPELIYPEAVYLHNGESYFVRSLDLEGRVAYVERHEMDYYTQAILESHVRVTESREGRTYLQDNTLGFGDVDVTWKTVAFKKIKFSTRENIGYGSVDLPEQTLDTTALWLIPGEPICMRLKELQHRLGEALCGLRNLAVVALPMVAMCDSRDVSGVVDSKNFGRHAMILYDRYPGGLGYAEQGFLHPDELWSVCLEIVQACQCVDGCPSCVGLPNLRPAIHSDPDLSRGYPIPDKGATLALLEMLATTNGQLVERQPFHNMTGSQ